MVIIVFKFIGCGDNKNNDPPDVSREFNDLTFLEKNIKLIDETGNTKKSKGVFGKK